MYIVLIRHRSIMASQSKMNWMTCIKVDLNKIYKTSTTYRMG